MAKRRKQTPQRTHVYQAGQVRPGFSRRQPAKPEQSGPSRAWILVGAGLAVIVAVGAVAYFGGFFGRGAPSPSNPSLGAVRPSFDVHPPSATPLASPPTAPVGDGTTATISTELGDITFEIFNQSAPVASENFINLADVGYYDGLVFHRIIPDFMIQGGDPNGNGSGGPGYTIEDEPIVGSYTRGMVAMARTSAPHSQGSQFFILVKDTPSLNSGGYTIFGRVTSGMEVADQISLMPNGGGQGSPALDPVVMDSVTIDGPNDAI